jgi:hypothetical protein
LVKAIFFQEAVQGHARDAHRPSAFDEVKKVVTSGLGMLKEKLSDRTGKARQQFAMRTPSETMVSGLNDFFGGKALLGGGRRAAHAKQTADLSDFQSRVAVEQEVAEQTRRVIVGATTLAKSASRVQKSALIGS